MEAGKEGEGEREDWREGGWRARRSRKSTAGRTKAQLRHPISHLHRVFTHEDASRSLYGGAQLRIIELLLAGGKMDRNSRRKCRKTDINA